jgi:hypothetical protein
MTRCLCNVLFFLRREGRVDIEPHALQKVIIDKGSVTFVPGECLCQETEQVLELPWITQAIRKITKAPMPVMNAWL